ncbi:MAG: hypothetical protein HKN24_06395 [Acidimicrobiales bacterium]|nr:hypothetical protein [Acidimicrobiales bacterium]
MRTRGSERIALIGSCALFIAGMVAIALGLGVPGVPVEAGAFVQTGTVTIDGTSVIYSEGPTQTLANGQGCTLSTGTNVLEFDGSKNVGLVSGSIGIKSKGNGQDCGQVDGAEVLEVSLGTDPVADDQAIYKADIDLEVLQDAGVTLTASLVDADGDSVVVGTFTLLTGAQVPAGTSGVDNTPLSTTTVPEAYCNPESSSGPNSAESDNCFWTIESDSPFNTFTITEDFDGKVSLQGGDDWPVSGPGGPTVLYLTDAPDGILACGDEISTGGSSLGGVITRLGDPVTDPDCELKPYNFRVDGAVVEFEPEGSGARYMGEITKTIPEGQPISSGDWIEYDKDGDGSAFGFVPMQWCENNLLNSTTLPSTPDSDGPATWCVYEVNVSDPDGTLVTAVFDVYGEDDPHWR